jgi:hypothetical protein
MEMLVISGSMGAGKTTVLTEATDLLTATNVAHVALDLDYLGLAHFPARASGNVVLRNLVAVWNNYAALGVTRLLLSEAIETSTQKERLQRAFPSARIVICRLQASVATMQARIRLREQGVRQEAYVARVAVLQAALDAGGVEDYSVDNDGRPITDVAREVLERAGWLT